jgi:hypothetical protein
MAMHKITILALIALGVLLSGCCCCSNYVPGGISIPPTASPDATMDVPAGDDMLIGTWSSEGPYGTLYDPATGAATGSTYNGEWYAFRKDGTYRYVIMSSGIALSGGVVRDGRYSIEDGEIRFYENTESWYPDLSRSGQTPAYKNKPIEDERRTYEVQDTDTISIDDDSYYRISQQ